MTEDLLKVKTLLQTRGCSDRTVANYISSINRFKRYFEGQDIETFNEDDILNYIKVNFIDLGYSAASINVNRAAIKYYYLVNFNKDFNKVLLPACKIKNKFPVLISRNQGINLIKTEMNLKHRIWWCLGYGSGLRINEVATLKVSDILSKEHKIKVLGKGGKERFVPLPNLTFKLLCIYYKRYKHKFTDGYLFPSVKGNKLHISSFTIQQAFAKAKQNNNFDKSITFHTLRHSFATEYIKSGGDIWELRAILGHCFINTTMIYLHMAEDFSNVKSPLDGVN